MKPLDRLKPGECKFACYETSFEMPSGQIQRSHLFCGEPVATRMTSKGPVSSCYCATHWEVCLFIRAAHTRQEAIRATELLACSPEPKAKGAEGKQASGENDRGEQGLEVGRVDMSR
jgi:hypothetical protein